MAEVAIEGLVKDFGEHRAVDGIDLHVAEGEFVTLLGPSGCGKTTTLRCIAGLERPDQGRISIGNLGVVADDHTFVPPQKRNLGMVFQSYALWPHMTVGQNVGYPLRLRRTPANHRDRRVQETLDVVGLGHLGSRSVAALSGGQQQRVALARALVADPALVLFDEPLSNLDAKLRVSMRNELQSLHRRLGTTSIYVTHDQVEALTLSDRIVVMSQGEVRQVADPHTIFHWPDDAFVADFVGFDNLLPGVIEDTAPDSLLVHVPGVDETVTCRARPTRSVSRGDPVTVAVRASEIRVRPADESGSAEAGEVAIPGRVRQVAFVGERYEVEVQIGNDGLTLTASMPSIGAGLGLDRGDPAVIQIAQDSLLAVHPDRQTAAGALSTSTNRTAEAPMEEAS